MSDDVRIRLTWDEILEAALVGCVTNIDSLKRKYVPGNNAPEEENWTFNIEGRCGEKAVAKHFGVYWAAMTNMGNPKADDVGPYQTKTNTSRKWDDLILRDSDNIDRNYISVLSFLPDFVITGWMEGTEVKQEKWRREGSPGRAPAFFFPRKLLHPLRTLPGLVVARRRPLV